MEYFCNCGEKFFFERSNIWQIEIFIKFPPFFFATFAFPRRQFNSKTEIIWRQRVDYDSTHLTRMESWACTRGMARIGGDNDEEEHYWRAMSSINSTHGTSKGRCAKRAKRAFDDNNSAAAEPSQFRSLISRTNKAGNDNNKRKDGEEKAV